MAPPKGNKNAIKLKTPEIKELAYKEYCDHLAKGKSRKSWCFVHPECTLTWETMEVYIDKSPVDFPPLQRKIAEIKGYAHWEDVCEKSAQGLNEANTASLQMVMRNKYGWDKEDQQAHVACAADKILDVIKGRK